MQFQARSFLYSDGTMSRGREEYDERSPLGLSFTDSVDIH